MELATRAREAAERARELEKAYEQRIASLTDEDSGNESDGSEQRAEARLKES